MNKGRRNELKILHYKRRIRKIRPLALAGEDAYYAYRSHSTPCSCWCCRSPKYNRAKAREQYKKIAEPVSELVVSASGVLRQSPYIPYIEGDEEGEDKMMEIWRKNNFDD